MNDRARTRRRARAPAPAIRESTGKRPATGFAVFDRDWRLVAANAAFATLRGYPRKLVRTGTPLEALVRFDVERGEYGAGAAEALTRSKLAALKRGRPAGREVTLAGERMVHIACERLPDGGLALTCEDVTDVRRREARLGESEERYDFAMRAIREGVYDWDIAGGTIYYSDRVRKVLGLPIADFKTPAHWRARIHPDDLARYDACLVAHFKGETERFECDYRYRGRDGSWRWARQHGVALRDARGRAYRMVGSTGDITELKRMEAALHESDERLALAMRAAVEGIYEWNLETGTLFPSHQAKAFFAIQVGELAPSHWNERIHPDDFPAYRRALIEYFKGGTPHLECEYRIRDAAGGYGWVLDRGVAVRNAAGRVTKLIGALSDVTPRKTAELELRQARDRANEALAEQTAVREFLEAISRTAFDLEAVLRTLIESASRLCGAERGFIFRLDGAPYRLAVDYGGVTAEFREFITQHPIRPGRDTLVGRTALEKRAVHIEDVLADREYRWPQSQRLGGQRTMLGVPIIRDGAVIGVIAMWKERVAPFTAAQIALVSAFSNQALIAIENARLFKETKEALERQTATAEILRVISSSPTDLAPVFDVILESSLRLCEGDIAGIWQFDGTLLHFARSVGGSVEGTAHLRQNPLPLGAYNPTPQAGLERRPVHVLDVFADARYRPLIPRDTYGTLPNSGTVLAVPLLRGGDLLGVITIWRSQKRLFTDRQVAMVTAFADQAVIAIENVRLLEEVRARTHELQESLGYQTATSEVLKAISRSTFDLGAVLETLVSTAMRLCRADMGQFFRLDGDAFRWEAGAGINAAYQAIERASSIRLDRGTLVGRTGVERRTVHVYDALADPEYAVKDEARIGGVRTMLGVPLMRAGQLFGVFAIARARVEPFEPRQIELVGVFADQAVIAMENVRLFNETKEALEKQTAISEILRVISSSPTDVQPVFDTIVRSAVKLCGSANGALFRYDGERLHYAAGDSPEPEWVEAVRSNYPMRPEASTVAGRAILTRSLVHIDDVLADPEYDRARALKGGWRRMLAVPMVRDGPPLGVIVVSWTEPGHASKSQEDLLRTFADQAAIAIENVRLFNETKEALEQQRASAEVLTVISNSMADARPVFDKIVESCERLFASSRVGLNLIGPDGLVHAGAYGSFPGAERLRKENYPHPVAGSATGAAIGAGQVVHYPDVLGDPDIPPYARRGAVTVGLRSFLMAPLLSEGRGLGAIFVGRETVGAFTEKEIVLLKTFADQAVIAIQNARLFNETKEALEQQTATAEILRVISSSPTDVQPVFDAIAQSGVRLFQGVAVTLRLVRGDRIERVAFAAAPGCEVTVDSTNASLPLDDRSFAGRAVQRRELIHVPDIPAADWVGETSRTANARMGVRAIAAAPMRRDNKVLGVIAVTRSEAGPFSDRELALLTTFADQAVIAIENVRLFNETKEALERQTATAEILRVISASPTDVQPVFDAIVRHAGRLAAGCSVNVSRLVGERLEMAAYTEVSPEADKALLSAYPIRVDEVEPIAEAVASRSPVLVGDWEGDARATAKSQAVMRARGFRSTLYVPIVRGDAVYGVMHVSKPEPGPFPDHWVNMLRIFADQAVIAIENVRLFNETKEALDHQKASAEVLQVISSSVADTQPVFDKILESCERLFQGLNVGISPVGDDGAVHLAAYHGPNREELERHYPVPLSEESGAGMAILQRRVIHYPDVQHGAAVPDYVRRGAGIAGNKSIMLAPMLWEGRGIGAIFVGREAVGEFSEKEIALLKTFADQAVIAIQNAKLFREIQEKSHQLEIANQHKSAFLANMSHELRTPLNAVIGFSEMLNARYFGDLTDKQAEYVNDIHGSGKHLLSLINDILDLSKIEAGRMELETSDFDLRAALDNALTLVRERAQRGGIAVRLETDPALGPFHGDERKVKQVVLNLLSNAVKFTPRGGTVDVVARKANGSAEIAVSDTGVGIAPADREAIFEAFRQVGTDVTRKREGTGLGLALSRRFVELHGGTIRVESEPGKGSTFTVTLPLRHGE